MHIDRIRQQDCKISEWSGGSTCEWMIYPKKSSYQARDFLWRVSTATIQNEHSVFTSLPGIERRLVLLDGVCLLVRQQGNVHFLLPFDSVEFSGNEKTESFGSGSDFNLMTGPQCFGKIETAAVSDTNMYTIPRSFFAKSKRQFVLIYPVEREIRCDFPEKVGTYRVQKDELLCCTSDNPEEFSDVTIHGLSSQFSRVLITCIYVKEQ